METFIRVLALIGGTTIMFGIVCGLVSLTQLYERVARLEHSDDMKRDDIVDIKNQLLHIKEWYKE